MSESDNLSQIGSQFSDWPSPDQGAASQHDLYDDFDQLNAPTYIPTPQSPIGSRQEVLAVDIISNPEIPSMSATTSLANESLEQLKLIGVTDQGSKLRNDDPSLANESLEKPELNGVTDQGSKIRDDDNRSISFCPEILPKKEKNTKTSEEETEKIPETPPRTPPKGQSDENLEVIVLPLVLTPPSLPSPQVNIHLEPPAVLSPLFNGQPYSTNVIDPPTDSVDSQRSELELVDDNQFFVVCEQCGQRIDPNTDQEHKDFHYAMSLQRAERQGRIYMTNQPEKSVGKWGPKTTPAKKRTKPQSSSIIKTPRLEHFFKVKD